MSPAQAYQNEPYKGHESYQIEDSGMFFGRPREGDQLIAKILASPFTVLHAQSGAGKTSLLNARVIPGLEERGWTVVLARPHFNPSLSLRVAVIAQVLPPPAFEAEALARAQRQLCGGRDPALSELLDQFDLLSPKDERRRALLQPFEPTQQESDGVDAASSIQVRPLFFRLMRATLDIQQFGEHVAALLDPTAESQMPAYLDSHVSVGALQDLLAKPVLAAGRQTLVGRVAGAETGLKPFCERLIAEYGRRRTQFGLVLIMDQFEELFTRFTGKPGGKGGTAQPGYDLRFKFFEELSELHAATPALPVRVVLSLRDEFIAKLDPIRRFVRELDTASYHLTFLEKAEGRTCIEEPARLFGYKYSEEVYTDIFSALLREDRFVEPSQLQIVCKKLWEHRGSAGAIGMDALPPGGARAVLENFFSEYLDALDRLDPTGTDRLEALDILDSLVVEETNTRNIVEKSILERAPFHDPARRARVLRNLVDKRIIRLEPRLGGEFAEITHEFLIASVRERIAAELCATGDAANLRWVLRTVFRYRDIDFREGTSNLLGRTAFEILNKSRDKVYIGNSKVEGIFPELMLRSALALNASRDTLEHWMGRFAESGVVPTLDDILSEDRLNDPGRRQMSLFELSVVEQAPESESVSREQAEFVLNSLLDRATDSDRDSLIKWTRLVVKHGT